MFDMATLSIFNPVTVNQILVRCIFHTSSKQLTSDEISKLDNLMNEAKYVVVMQANIGKSNQAQLVLLTQT